MKLHYKYTALKLQVFSLFTSQPLCLQDFKAIMSKSMVVALKTLFCVLTCVMGVMLVYLWLTDFTTCFDQTAWWMMTVEADFMVDYTYVSAWYFYKESSWIKRLLFLFLALWDGSFVTCGYIAVQLFKLSPEESSTDPIFFVLAKRQKGDVMGHTRRYSVVTARVIVAALGLFMIGVPTYAYMVDGSPFHAEVVTQCMKTSLTDVKNHVIAFSVWIAYMETSWTSTVVWILLQVCFGSLTLSIYILQQLFLLSPEQPIHFILFNQHGRDLMTNDPLLTEHSNV